MAHLYSLSGHDIPSEYIYNIYKTTVISNLSSTVYIPSVCIINKFVKYNQAMKWLNCIFIVFWDLIKCIWFIHDLWPFSDNLIVYCYLFALVLFQIVKISHYVQLYVIIYWKNIILSFKPQYSYFLVIACCFVMFKACIFVFYSCYEGLGKIRV